MCFDCAAANPNVTEGEHDELWAHRYRDSYRTSTGYVPIDTRRRDFDSQDARSFDDRDRDLREDDADRGSFGAS